MLKILFVTMITACIGGVCWLVAAWLYVRRSTRVDRRRGHEDPFVQGPLPPAAPDATERNLPPATRNAHINEARRP